MKRIVDPLILLGLAVGAGALLVTGHPWLAGIALLALLFATSRVLAHRSAQQFVPGEPCPDCGGSRLAEDGTPCRLCRGCGLRRAGA